MNVLITQVGLGVTASFKTTWNPLSFSLTAESAPVQKKQGWGRFWRKRSDQRTKILWTGLCSQSTRVSILSFVLLAAPCAKKLLSWLGPKPGRFGSGYSPIILEPTGFIKFLGMTIPANG